MRLTALIDSKVAVGGSNCHNIEIAQSALQVLVVVIHSASLPFGITRNQSGHSIGHGSERKQILIRAVRLLVGNGERNVGIGRRIGIESENETEVGVIACHAERPRESGHNLTTVRKRRTQEVGVVRHGRSATKAAN